MFKNLSNRVSAKTIEETYTENDVEHVKDEHGKETTDISLNYIPNTGFTFDYPQRWLNEETDFKAIGIRRLKVVPTSHVFSLNIGINYKFMNYNDLIINKEPHVVRELYYSASITSNNTLEEIIHNLVNTLNIKLHETPMYLYSQENGKDVLDEIDVLGAFMALYPESEMTTSKFWIILFNFN